MESIGLKIGGRLNHDNVFSGQILCREGLRSPKFPRVADVSVWPEAILWSAPPEEGDAFRHQRKLQQHWDTVSSFNRPRLSNGTSVLRYVSFSSAFYVYVGMAVDG